MKLKKEDYKILETTILYQVGSCIIKNYKVQLQTGQITDWVAYYMPDTIFAVTIKNDKVMMTKEFRVSNEIITQFTGARIPENGTQEEALKELKRELSEELGVIGGEFNYMFKTVVGGRIGGKRFYYKLTNFDIGETHRDEFEVQEIIYLPIKGLFKELSENHWCSGETLLAAKLIEEEYNKYE